MYTWHYKYNGRSLGWVILHHFLILKLVSELAAGSPLHDRSLFPWQQNSSSSLIVSSLSSPLSSLLSSSGFFTTTAKISVFSRTKIIVHLCFLFVVLIVILLSSLECDTTCFFRPCPCFSRSDAALFFPLERNMVRFSRLCPCFLAQVWPCFSGWTRHLFFCLLEHDVNLVCSCLG